MCQRSAVSPGESAASGSDAFAFLYEREAQLDTAGSFAVFIILSLLGVALTSLLRLVRRRMLSWMPIDESQKTVSV